jgi:hypothetical protein
MEVKYFSAPTDIKSFGNGKIEFVKVNDALISKITYKPGWKWSENIKPLAKTDLCMATHYMYLISGTLRVKMADGTEQVIKHGSISLIPPGHDAWVVGSEPAVGIDFQGVVDAARTSPEIAMGIMGVMERG